MSIGSNPGDPLNAFNLIRAILMDSQGNYLDQRTAAATMTDATGPGTTPQGAQEVTIQNVGGGAAKVAGANLPAGQQVAFRTQAPGGMAPISYDGTGTNLLVTAVALAPAPGFPSYTQDVRGVGNDLL